jgi:small nuclear ribonucleoprotein (snRNP)-like protein
VDKMDKNTVKEKVEKPFDYLGKFIGKRINVYLKNGETIEGEIVAFDIHLNLVLADVTVKKENEDLKLESLFVRGDNILYVFY